MRIACAAAAAACLTAAAWASEPAGARLAVDADQMQRTMEAIHARALADQAQVGAQVAERQLAEAPAAPEDRAGVQRR